jgi:hypothetical protein
MLSSKAHHKRNLKHHLCLIPSSFVMIFYTLGSFPLLEHLNLGVLLEFMSKFHFNNLSYHTKNRLLNQPIDNDEPKFYGLDFFIFWDMGHGSMH